MIHEVLKQLEDARLHSNCNINRNWRKLAPLHQHLIDMLLMETGTTSFAQALYHVKHNLDGVPSCETCKTPLLFIRGYNKFCSKSCSAKSPSTKQHREDTNLKKFGVKYPAQSGTVKVETIAARTKKYGEKPPHLFGGSSFSASMMKKYGASNAAQVEKFAEAAGRFKKSSAFKMYMLPLHIKVRDWLVSLGEEVIENDRTILRPLEVDLYLPHHKLGIEINGLYWHSDRDGTSKFKHQEKTLLALKNGVTLIHLFEDQINLHFDVIAQKIIDNYLSIEDDDIDIKGTLEVNGCWPLPQQFNATLVDHTEPKHYMIDANFKPKIVCPVWDSGMLFYVKGDRE